MSELDPAVPTGCPQSRYRALVTDPWVARCVTVACSGSKWLPTAATPRTRASTNLGVVSTESVLERNKFAARHRRGRFRGVWAPDRYLRLHSTIDPPCP